MRQQLEQLHRNALKPLDQRDRYMWVYRPVEHSQLDQHVLYRCIPANKKFKNQGGWRKFVIDNNE